MENENKNQKSELWNKIYEKVKELPRDNTVGDSIDHRGLSNKLEQLFLEESKNNKIANDIKGSYIEVKIVTSSTLSLNDNQKIIEQFKEHGFEFHGEPIIQSDGITHWSFMVKNGLVNK